MPYLPTLDLNAGGCKIAVDGSTALSTTLSTAIFYLKFYKNTKIQRENNSPLSSPFETLTLTLAQTSSPQTLARILALCRNFGVPCRRKGGRGRKKEGGGRERKQEGGGRGRGGVVLSERKKGRKRKKGILKNAKLAFLFEVNFLFLANCAFLLIFAKLWFPF